MKSNNLKAIRLSMGMTQTQFARKYGYDVGNISKMEKGLRHIPVSLKLKLGITETAWTAGDIERVRFILSKALW